MCLWKCRFQIHFLPPRMKFAPISVLIIIFWIEFHWAVIFMEKHFQFIPSFVPKLKEKKGFDVADSAPKFLFQRRQIPVPAKISELIPISLFTKGITKIPSGIEKSSPAITGESRLLLFFVYL